MQNGEGVADRSKEPLHKPRKTAEEVEGKILEVQENHPTWGARKIHRVLENRGESELPAASKMNAILKRNGLVSKEASMAATPCKRFERKQPNELWQTDFKGHFEMKNWVRCHPLTVLDDHSRYSLCIDAKENEQRQGVIESFARLFDVYGLPESLLCDNGNPWGNSQTNGYTLFEIWLMNRDILPIHGRVKHPQTQGKEERFHRTMKAELLKRTQIANLEDAQRQFDLFRESYNNERPHQALKLDVPAQHYRPSKRRAPDKIESEWMYPQGYKTRQIKVTGYVTIHGQGYFLSEAFGGMRIGIRESSLPNCVNLYYRDFRIARLNIDERTFISRKIYRVEDTKS